MDQASDFARSGLSARFTVGPDCGLLEHPCGGIALEARKLELGDIALALIADLAGVDGGQNLGMSATGSMNSIVRAYRQTILDALVAEDVLWVKIDSLGGFDLVLVHAERAGMQIDWRPLLSGWSAGRTKADFLALFGRVGEEMLGKVRGHRSASR